MRKRDLQRMVDRAIEGGEKKISLELTLRKGGKVTGDYGPSGTQGGVNLYTTRQGWINYPLRQIKSASIYSKGRDFSTRLEEDEED
jgi:hypothetical protein